MNHLLVDAGNTFCKLALYNDKKDIIQFEKKFSYNNIEEDIKYNFSDLPISSIMVSNVNNEKFDTALIDIANTNWEIQPKFLKSHNCHTELKSHYNDIKALGCDRWAAMLAIYYQNQKNFCVIDCGTAITVDLVINSFHIGGLIAPGIYTSFKALNKNTANLPNLSKTEQIDSIEFIGKNTQDCINRGVINQALALIEYTIEVYRRDYDKNISVYLTGGDSRFLHKFIKTDMVVKGNLVIDGLKMAVKHQLVLI